MPTDIEDFPQRLRRAFPPEPFYGLVSTHDECDDGIALRQEFAGKSGRAGGPYFPGEYT